MVRVIIESGLVNAIKNLDDNSPKTISLEGYMEDRIVRLTGITEIETKIERYKTTRPDEKVPFYTPVIHTSTLVEGYLTIQLDDEMFSKPIIPDELRYNNKRSISIHPHEDSG